MRIVAASLTTMDIPRSRLRNDSVVGEIEEEMTRFPSGRRTAPSDHDHNQQKHSETYGGRQARSYNITRSSETTEGIHGVGRFICVVELMRPMTNPTANTAKSRIKIHEGREKLFQRMDALHSEKLRVQAVAEKVHLQE